MKTRYYDAEKEAFDERVRSAMQQNGSSNSAAEAVKARIRSNFQQKRKIYSKQDDRSRMIRIALILGGLSLLFYLILK